MEQDDLGRPIFQDACRSRHIRARDACRKSLCLLVPFLWVSWALALLTTPVLVQCHPNYIPWREEVMPWESTFGKPQSQEINVKGSESSVEVSAASPWSY